MRHKRFSLSTFALWAALAACSSGCNAQPDIKTQQWQARAQATADNSKQAREVILDAIYAGQTVPVALAYQTAMQQKPGSQTRLDNFAWAAMMTEEYDKQRNDPVVDKMAGRAVHSIKPLITRSRDDVKTPEQYKIYAAFRPTSDPMAWLVWAHYLARFIFNATQEKLDAERAYKKALSLDPTLAEAYYGLADLVSNPYDAPYFKMRSAVALDGLDKAEELQPKLHPLAVRRRASIAAISGQYATAANYDRQYLRLWPNAPHADALRQDIATFDRMSRKP